MFHLTYVSSAAQDFSKAELNELLVKCRENNAKLGLTGMLLYKDGNFMQVLEGEEGVVREVYAKISTDPRHTGEILLHQSPLEERQFPDWSMGLHDLDSPEARTTPATASS